MTVLGRYITEENGCFVIFLAGNFLRAHNNTFAGDLLGRHLIVLAQRQKQKHLELGHGFKPLGHTAIRPRTAQILCLGQDIPMLTGYLYRDIVRGTQMPALFLGRRLRGLMMLHRLAPKLGGFLQLSL